MNDQKNLDPVAIAAGIHDEPIDQAQIETARERVAAHLPQATAAEAPAHDAIESCEDFARLIPAFVAGELPEPRRVLVQDHTRSCVPCRRVLMAARSRDLAAGGASVRPAVRSSRVALRFAAAASVLLAVSAGMFIALRQRPVTGQLARVQSVEGQAMLPNGQAIRPASADTALAASEVIRTGRSSRAVLALADGSRVEMAERSELSISGRRDGLTVRLGRGHVIVEAAKQRDGKHLAIATSDCEVTVVGTVFSVAHGTRGSRVSVLEGEVKVASGGKTQALKPGEQTSTAEGAEAVSIRSEVAWSERNERYLGLLGEIDSLRREIARSLPASSARTATRLLDVAPAGTAVYAAIPNVAGDLLASYRLVVAKVEKGGLLGEHFSAALGSPEARAQVEEALTLLGELGEKLGDEIAIAVPFDGENLGGPVLYAEARRPRELADFLPGFVGRVNAAAKKTVHRDVESATTDAPEPRAHADVLTLGSAGTLPEHEMVISQEGELLVLAAGRGPLEAFRRGVAGTSFAGSPFHQRVATAYRSGVHQIFAADLRSLIDRVAPSDAAASAKRETFERLGVMDADSLIVTRAVAGDTATSRAELGFGHERRGIAAWLAEPAPMGSLDFISSSASLAAVVVVKEPSALVGELFEIFQANSPDFEGKLASLQQELGIDIREDLAASLGGEIAMAVDGPLLPTPSVEVIAEVYDAGRLQNALQRLASSADARLRREGKPGLALTSTDVSGRTFHALGREGADPWLHWTYEDGYLVAAPARVLIERAIRTRESGASLRTSPDFISRLPGDGPLDVSLFVWQNLGPVLKTQSAPTLGYAWGGKDRVVFSATGETLMGLELPAIFSLMHRKPDA